MQHDIIDNRERKLAASVKPLLDRKRFPEDFMFQLSAEEYESIRSQFVTTSHGKKPANLFSKVFSPSFVKNRVDIRCEILAERELSGNRVKGSRLTRLELRVRTKRPTPNIQCRSQKP